MAMLHRGSAIQISEQKRISSDPLAVSVVRSTVRRILGRCVTVLLLRSAFSGLENAGLSRLTWFVRRPGPTAFVGAVRVNLSSIRTCHLMLASEESFMSAAEPAIYDVLGVGFGPSGLALAIALEELPDGMSQKPVSLAFLERQERFGWHRNMLLPSAKMQVAFLKDLVTFRDPTSRFSFVSYLHSMGRLAQFVNNGDFYPTRREFHNYLEWAAAKVADRVTYSAEVIGVRLPADDRRAEHLEVEVTDRRHGKSRVLNARNVIVSTGLSPTMPDGIERGDAVWHSSELMERFQGCDLRNIRRVVVVGGGQSAAEAARFLYDALPDATVNAVIPSYGYSVADSTPFANQIFDPGAVDDHYFASANAREMFWRYHRNTNYSVVNDEVIRDLYQRAYDDAVNGVHRLTLSRLSRLVGLKSATSGIQLSVLSQLDEKIVEINADLLVCATGYATMQPDLLLNSLDKHLLRDAAGRYQLDRDYRLVSAGEPPWGIYLQGGSEHTHGLSSSLLSNIAVRSGEIAESIVSRGARHEFEYAVATDAMKLVTTWTGMAKEER
jgi:L-ornithine N5-oxygenase